MKQPKRLTREQKIIIANQGLQPGQFLLIEETDTTLVLHDKGNGTRVTVPKSTKGKGATPWLCVKPER